MKIIDHYQLTTYEIHYGRYYLGVKYIDGKRKDVLRTSDSDIIDLTKTPIVNFTGWIQSDTKEKMWFIKGIRATAQEVFESLTDEEKDRVIWELDEWK